MLIGQDNHLIMVGNWVLYFCWCQSCYMEKQETNCVSRSSAEAEYRATAHTTCEIIWLQALLEELGFGVQLPMYCDNHAAIHIASNPVFHERSQHIEKLSHCSREDRWWHVGYSLHVYRSAVG